MQLAIDDIRENAGEAEEFLKLLANKNRLMLLCSLLDEELCVSDLNERVPLSQSALSQHLATLRQAGTLATRRDKQTIYYRIKDPRVAQILATLADVFCAPQTKTER
jgi:DNA-binding transcriptional ArsR family regulator